MTTPNDALTRLPVRHCWVCEAEIHECMGFTLVRDVLAERHPPRESCSRCADRLSEFMAPLNEKITSLSLRCAELERAHQGARKERAVLETAVRRIDAMNDNPADFNAEINGICDAILRPYLAPLIAENLRALSERRPDAAQQPSSNKETS